MRFHLLDRVTLLTESRIEAEKYVSQAEEYLADHFPSFPVLPGVMMLEAATQAAAWLAMHRAGFAGDGDYTGPTVAVLKSARNLRYGHFVAPGHSLRLGIDFDKDVEGGLAVKISGTVDVDGDTKTAVTGKLELSLLRLADREAALAPRDDQLVAAHRARWTALVGTSAVASQ